MRLWRINLKPGSKPGIDATEFCVRQSVVGIGWQVDPIPTTPDECWAAGKQRYSPTCKRKWSAAAKAILYTMTKDDLIWTRNRKGTYYLGRITGPWEYKADPEFRDADLVNVRPCEWVCAGAMDTVPGRSSRVSFPGEQSSPSTTPAP